MTTTIRAHFDGKVIVPHGQVDLPVDEELTIQVAPPLSEPATIQTVEELRALFAEMKKHSVKVDHFIDHSRESCYD